MNIFRVLLFTAALFFGGGFFVNQSKAAPQYFNCGAYSGNCSQSTACSGGTPIYNSNGYCSAGRCCLTAANSDRLNADVIASGNTPVPSPLPRPNPQPQPSPLPGGGGGGGGGGTAPCASPGACTPSSNCVAPNAPIAGVCPNSGVCCAPAGNGGGSGGGNGSGGVTTGTPVTVTIQNPLKYSTVEEFLSSLLIVARNIVVLLALIFIILGALMYITSGGNDKRISAAKACITAALIGFAIVLAAPAFLKEIANILGWGALPSEVSGSLSLSVILAKVLGFLLSLIGVIAIIMMLIGSIMYLTSAGDEKRANTGKSIVKYAVIGIVVAFSAVVIIKQIAAFFV